MAKKKQKTIAIDASAIINRQTVLPAPLAIGGLIQTLIGSLIYIKTARPVEKRIQLDCLVLRDTFDGKMSKGRPVMMEIGENEEIHYSRSPLSKCTPVEITDDMAMLIY
jgi:hypothetical protein